MRERAVVTWMIVLLFIWTTLLGIIVLHVVRERKNETRQIALHEAQVAFDRDQAMRHWVTSHGGVYVPTTERTPSNVNLAHIPERDLKTPSGRKLTLMNPAYVMRQYYEEFNGRVGVRGHITSLKLMRAENAPDQWEAAALKRFEQGEKERIEFTELDGKPFLRMMRPMITERGCLKCHAAQGYQIGEVRGGVSVSLPLEFLLEQERKDVAADVAGFAILWLTGMLGIVVAARGIRSSIIARDRAEEALSASELKYRALIQSANDAVVVHTVEPNGAPGGFIEVNEVACQRYGYTRDEFMQIGPMQLDCPGADDRVRHAVSLLVQDGHAVFETTHCTKDGRPIPVEVSSRFFNIGVQRLCISLARDITERKQAELELLENEEKFKQLSAAAQDGIIMLDHDGVVIFWNLAAERITGYAATEALGQRLHEFLAPTRYRDDFQKGFKIFLQTGAGPVVGRTTETFARTKAGREVPVELSISAVCLKGVWHAIGILRDISGRKQDEEALQRQNAMMDNIISMTTTCIAYLDRDFNFIRVNERYAEADGRTSEYFIGKNHFALYPNEENESIFRRVVESGREYVAHAKPFEYKDHPERGVSHWDWSLNPVQDADGRVYALILSLVDVTDRIRAQEEVSRLNKELEQRVLERTAELEAKNRELDTLNKMFIGRELRMAELKEQMRRMNATEKE